MFNTHTYVQQADVGTKLIFIIFNVLFYLYVNYKYIYTHIHKREQKKLVDFDFICVANTSAEFSKAAEIGSAKNARILADEFSIS